MFWCQLCRFYCRKHVGDAGYSLEPSWGDGAQCFIPLTPEQVAEAELELSFDHVVILQSDIERLKAVSYTHLTLPTILLV